MLWKILNKQTFNDQDWRRAETFGDWLALRVIEVILLLKYLFSRLIR